jgi:hypothetical protein
MPKIQAMAKEFGAAQVAKRAAAAEAAATAPVPAKE